MEDIKVEDDYCSLQYEFDLFFEAVKSGSKSTLSIDNLPFVKLQKRPKPTNELFCVALLSEIVRNLAPNHVDLCSKISYAAFLLQLVVGDANFSSVYDIFHQVELFVQDLNLSWTDSRVKDQFLNKVVEITGAPNGQSYYEKYSPEDEVTRKSKRTTKTKSENVKVMIKKLKHESESEVESDKDDLDYDPIVGQDNDFDFSDGEINKFEDKESHKVKVEGLNSVNIKNDLDNGKDDLDNKDGNKKKKCKYQCEHCEFSSYSEVKRETHAIEVHKKYKKCPEPQCGHVSKTYKDLKKHRKTHYALETCEKCDKEFSKPSYIIHLKKVHNATEEEIAPLRFKKKKPPRAPTKRELAKCPLCDYSNPHESSRIRHAIEVHNEHKLCSQCGYVSKTYSDYTKHNNTHNLLNCEICNQAYMGQTGLQQHMRLAHKDDKTPEETEGKIPCELCGKLIHGSSMNTHLEHVHSTQEFKCDLCDHVTNAEYKLKLHRMRHFMKKDECPKCGIMVKNMRSHFRRACKANVIRERVNCNVCNKDFSTKNALDRHVKFIHERTLNHHCELCEYKTYTGFNLKIHISKMHTKEVINLACEYCDKKTHNMELHIKTFHFQHYHEYLATKEKKVEDLFNNRADNTLLSKTIKMSENEMDIKDNVGNLSAKNLRQGTSGDFLKEEINEGSSSDNLKVELNKEITADEVSEDEMESETLDKLAKEVNNKNNTESEDTIQFEFKQFCESVNSCGSEEIFTLDHLPYITLQKKTNPTNEMFVVALLTEIMRYLVPNHTEFRAKISYAAFLFQLMVGDDSESYPIFDIFHKVELFVDEQNISWSDDKVQEHFFIKLKESTKTRKKEIDKEEDDFYDINVKSEVDELYFPEEELLHPELSYNEDGSTIYKTEDLDGSFINDSPTTKKSKKGSSTRQETPCPICHKVIAYRHHLLRHIRNVHKTATNFQCTFCQFKTYLSDDLRSHLIKNHPNEDLPTAFTKLDQETNLNSDNLKQESLDDSDKVLQSMDDSNNSSEYSVKQEKEKKEKKLKKNTWPKKQKTPCPICNKVFAYKHDMSKHVKNIHEKVMNYHCDVCEYKTYHASNLRFHKQKNHPNGEPSEKRPRPRNSRYNPAFDCPHCDFRAFEISKRERHAIEVHNEYKLCTDCGHVSKTYSDYKKHSSIHEIIPCNSCGGTFMGKRSLLQHIRNAHPDENEKILAKKVKKQVVEEKVACEECGVQMKKHNLQAHVENVHGTEEIKCDLCDYVANSKQKMKWHTDNHFSDFKECPNCGKMTKKLKAHFRECTKKSLGEQEKIPCDICNKEFSDKHTLEKHVKAIHYKILDHHCNFCSYKTYTKFNLRVHIAKMHTKENLARECPHCAKITMGLESHIKIFHFEHYKDFMESKVEDTFDS